MNVADLNAKAESFRAMHRRGQPVLLPSAWDPASAVLVAEAGFEVVATTSAGVAWALGRPDGQAVSRDEMVGAVARIAAAVSVPVTADMEAGYGESSEAVAETVRATLASGAIGLNIEDGIDHAKGTVFGENLAVERIAAARAAAKAAGVAMVINARTDVAFDRARPEAEKLLEAIRRGNAYLEAGADCVYPILFQNIEAIRTLANGIRGPINVMASANLDVTSLAEAGVARISLATALPRIALSHVRDALAGLKNDGRFAFLEGTIQTGELNAKFRR